MGSQTKVTFPHTQKNILKGIIGPLQGKNNGNDVIQKAILFCQTQYYTADGLNLGTDCKCMTLKSKPIGVEKLWFIIFGDFIFEGPAVESVSYDNFAPTK